MIAQWNVWKYQGESAKLIREGEEIPDGWYDSPGEALRNMDAVTPEPVKRGPGRPRKAV